MCLFFREERWRYFFVLSSLVRAFIIILCHGCFIVSSSSALLLLSDLPTPAFLINIDFVQQQQRRRDRHHPIISPILLPSSRQTLVPVKIEGVTCPLILLDQQLQQQCDDADEDLVNCAGTCYWHASVVRSRGDHDNDSSSTFLAEIDLPTNIMTESSSSTLSSSLPAQLVLGLNNHHVGSYYWARSAGTGAAMEAPCIQLLVDTVGSDKSDSTCSCCCCLHWASTQGPMACNSNDGKRSEWVYFLRPLDQVQLIPLQAEQSILQWITAKKLNDDDPTLQAKSARAADADESSSTSFSSLGRIFGVSNYKRPLGSEPAILCEYKLQQQ
jgi:hypothetical protein